MRAFWPSRLGQAILWAWVRLFVHLAYWKLRWHGATARQASDAVYLCLHRELPQPASRSHDEDR